MWYLGRMWDEDGIISTSKCAIFAFIYISFLNTQILCFCSMLVHIKPKFKSFVNYVLALRLAKTTKLFSKSASNLAETTSSSKFNFLFLQNFHQAKLFLQSGANLPRIYLYLQVEISKNILSSVKWNILSGRHGVSVLHRYGRESLPVRRGIREQAVLSGEYCWQGRLYQHWLTLDTLLWIVFSFTRLYFRTCRRICPSACL